MALRKCPGCKNTIAAETESCPICGCNPRTRQFRKFIVLGAALAGAFALAQNHLRLFGHAAHSGPVHAQTISAQ